MPPASLNQIAADIAVIKEKIKNIDQHTEIWNREMGEVQNKVGVHCADIAVMKSKMALMSKLMYIILAVLMGLAVKTYGVI